MDVRIEGHTLHLGALRLTLQRTLRIPDDGRRHPLPPGLGAFPMRRVQDCLRAPESWRAKGGILIPMYAREAMWLSLHGPRWRPHAVKVGVGKICAITGERWREGLAGDEQRYVVTPPQPWLDGIATGHGTIRQFVATSLGRGHTVEGQVTGEESVGGLQLEVFAGKASRFPEPPPRMATVRRRGGAPMACAPCAAPGAAMGLGAGGRMKQKIYPDPHGVDAYEERACARVFVHLVDALRWRELTGEEPPPTPVTAATYAQHGLPWYELYDDGMASLAPSDTLAAVKSLGAIDAAGTGLTEAPLPAPPVVSLPLGQPVVDGDW